tara:strand:- start:344 stop:652 length:309 start_codon:yes stop_codon:yes gene_type:complete
MKLNNQEKRRFNFKKHPCEKDLATLLSTDSIHNVLCIENDSNTIELFKKINNKSRKVGSLTFKKSNKTYEFDLLFLNGITLIREISNSNKVIFIRCSDLDFL